MTAIPEFRSPYANHLPWIPDNLTIPQFFLDYHHPNRPIRPENTPWFIDNDTGANFSAEHIRMRTWGLANALRSHWNIGDNDIVAIYSPNQIDFSIITWSVHRLGAAITTANPAFSADELAYQLTAIKASMLFAHTSVFDAALAAARSSGIPEDRVILIRPLSTTIPTQGFLTVDEVVSEGLCQSPGFVERRLSPGEAKTKVAFYNFSSGTTGKPKAVAIPHYSVIANVLQMAGMYRTGDTSVPPSMRRWGAGEVSLDVLPLFHIYGLVVNLYHAIFCGCSIVVVSKFSFRGMLDSIVRYRISNLFLVPPMVVMLCKHPAIQDYDLSCVRNIMVGAAPLSSELTMQLAGKLPHSNIFQGYGLTETVAAVTLGSPSQKIGTLGSAGQLIPGIVARILKSDGTYGGFGEQGELVVKSPANALCYSNDEQATKETFIDGWVRTGDEAIVNEKSEVFIIDRLKEIMKVKGFQVAPAELEGHLLDHPFVFDACVVGVPDEYSGELPFTFIVPDRKAAEMIEKGESAQVKATIMKHVADAKVAYKRLTGGIEFVDAIAKNPSGKLLRRLLREKAKELRAKIIIEQDKRRQSRELSVVGIGCGTQLDNLGNAAGTRGVAT